MKISWSVAVGITGLILGGTPSWGAPPPNIVVSDADENTAGGTTALMSNTTGTDNTAFGAEALESNTTGVGNSAFGDGALRDNTDGVHNTAIGEEALEGNTTGTDNTASGWRALQSNTTGSFNTACGNFSLNANTTGVANTAVGGALRDNTTGHFNTAVGSQALQSNTTGDRNTALGHGAGFFLKSGSDNIYIGNAGGDVSESNTLRLGSEREQTRTFIAGVAFTLLSGSTVLINSQGQLGIQASSIRYKRDIQPMGAHSRGLLQLRPVIFRYKQDAQDERQYGLIAEEVAKVYPELVTRGTNDEVESVRYQGLIPMLLNELQHQQGRLGAQAQQLSVLKADNERLQAIVAQQQERDEALAARLERLEAAAIRAKLANR